MASRRSGISYAKQETNNAMFYLLRPVVSSTERGQVMHVELSSHSPSLI